MVSNILEKFPRVRISSLPTPLEKLENISKDCSVNVYCKRDDLTGFAFGGNKTRKLEFLIADAIKKGSDSLVAVGALQSNFCRLAAAAGKFYGLEVHLVLGGVRPEKPTGNLLIANLFSPRIHYVDSDDWNVWEKKAEDLMMRLISKGRKAYLLHIGGSTPIGALGYLQAALEIFADCRRLGISIGTITHASSSGGTQAGLIVGKKLSRWPGKIIGMGVAKSADTLKADIFELASKTARLVGCSVESKDVIVDNSYMGAAYGARTMKCESAMKLFAEREGLVLDRVYTGKAAAGLLDYVRQGQFSSGENVLFVHTGGNTEIFA